LVCGADDKVFILDMCLCLFVLLDLSFICFFWVGFVVFGGRVLLLLLLLLLMIWFILLIEILLR